MVGTEGRLSSLFIHSSLPYLTFVRDQRLGLCLFPRKIVELLAAPAPPLSGIFGGDLLQPPAGHDPATKRRRGRLGGRKGGTNPRGARGLEAHHVIKC